jgi:hypothetical protein
VLVVEHERNIAATDPACGGESRISDRLLDDEHDRIDLACGAESLDRYLKTQAGQDVRRKANAVFVLSERDEPARILGYYALCAMAFSQGEVPEAARKHIPPFRW